MKKELISFRATQEDAEFIEKSAKQANMSKTDYMLHCIRHNEVRVVDRSKEIYQGLCGIQKVISTQEKMKPNQDYSEIREAVFAVCQLLKL